MAVPTQTQMVLDPNTGQYIPAQTQVTLILLARNVKFSSNCTVQRKNIKFSHSFELVK